MKIRTSEARELFALVRNDYAYTADVFTPDDARMVAIKRIIAETLTAADRNLLIMYAEVGSLQRTADMMHVSKNTLRKNIDRIRGIIKNKLV